MVWALPEKHFATDTGSEVMRKMKRVEAGYRRKIILAVLLIAAMALNTYAARAQYQPNDGWIAVLQFNRCLDADAGGEGTETKMELWDSRRGGGLNQFRLNPGLFHH
jgi:hypothetical protein